MAKGMAQIGPGLPSPGRVVACRFNCCQGLVQSGVSELIDGAPLLTTGRYARDRGVVVGGWSRRVWSTRTCFGVSGTCDPRACL